MSRTAQRRLAMTFIGFVLSSAALGVGRSELPTGPFGFHSLVFVHLLAAWPVAWGIAEWAISGTARNSLVAALAFATGAGIALATFTAGDALWRELNHGLPVGFFVGWLGRSLWAIALMLPWCLAARCLIVSPPGVERPSLGAVATFVASSALAAATVPAVFADYHFRRETSRLVTQLEEGRLAGAPQRAARLAAAGSHRLVTKRPIEQLRDQLTEQVALYRKLLAQPLPANAPADVIVQRGALFATLGEQAEAIELLTPLAATHAPAAVLLGSVLDDAERHAEAEVRFRAAIKLLESDSSPSADQLRVQAFDSLAETLRDQHQYAAAEQAYRDAIRSVPEAEAHFQFQLGRHYALGGRSLAALEAFERAAELDPSQFSFDLPDVDAQVRPLREGSPGCVLPDRFYTSP